MVGIHCSKGACNKGVGPKTGGARGLESSDESSGSEFSKSERKLHSLPTNWINEDVSETRVELRCYKVSQVLVHAGCLANVPAISRKI